MNSTQIMIETICTLHKCEDCPIRRQGMKRPHSIFSRIHRWHMTWWPGWKYYQAEMRLRGRAKAHA